MARLPLLPRLLRRPNAATADGAAPEAEPATEPVRRAGRPPAVAQLRRERRALLRVREERLRDLGGLALEMYRRDRFREDLLLERCAELIGLEARVHELESLLGGGRAPLGAPARARCACGAPLLIGARFCASCGRPVVSATGGAERPAGEAR